MDEPVVHGEWSLADLKRGFTVIRVKCPACNRTLYLRIKEETERLGRCSCLQLFRFTLEELRGED
jgi:hypothetical protein